MVPSRPGNPLPAPSGCPVSLDARKEKRHHETNTYLNYGGNCEQAFRFYEKHLGGKITVMMTQEQNPDPSNVPPNFRKAILYGRMTIGETEIMASDVQPDHFQPMRSVYLSLAVDSTPEAERLHALLSEGGEVFMPM
jgi:PhnB protein